MTAADHANTVRDALRYAQGKEFTATPGYAKIKAALAALDALQHQAETAEAALDREAGTQDALDTMREERDAHQRDTVRLAAERDTAVQAAEEWETKWKAEFASNLRSIKRATDAEQAAEQARNALQQIGQRQPDTIVWLRANGIVFDRAPNGDLTDWQHIAFLIYTDLCETESIARAALAGNNT